MADDIVTRLRSKPGPSECWHCGEWGCRNKAGQSLYSCEHDAVDCGCDNDCSCSCHTWWTHVREAADEIERLRAAGDALAEALDWNLSCPCNDEPLDGLDAEMNTRSLTAQRAWQEARRG